MIGQSQVGNHRTISYNWETTALPKSCFTAYMSRFLATRCPISRQRKQLEEQKSDLKI